VARIRVKVAILVFRSQCETLLHDATEALGNVLAACHQVPRTGTLTPDMSSRPAQVLLYGFRVYGFHLLMGIKIRSARRNSKLSGKYGLPNLFGNSV
jgi:hypothetical protein